MPFFRCCLFVHVLNPLPFMCLVIVKPLNPDTRDCHDCSLEPFVNQMPCVSFAERPSSATSVLAPSSQMHCSQWKVNTVAAFCRPSFVWPAQIKCCTALAVDRVPFLFFFLPVSGGLGRFSVVHMDVPVRQLYSPLLTTDCHVW